MQFIECTLPSIFLFGHTLGKYFKEVGEKFFRTCANPVFYCLSFVGTVFWNLNDITEYNGLRKCGVRAVRW